MHDSKHSFILSRKDKKYLQAADKYTSVKKLQNFSLMDACNNNYTTRNAILERGKQPRQSKLSFINISKDEGMKIAQNPLENHTGTSKLLKKYLKLNNVTLDPPDSSKLQYIVYKHSESESKNENHDASHNQDEMGTDISGEHLKSKYNILENNVFSNNKIMNMNMLDRPKPLYDDQKIDKVCFLIFVILHIYSQGCSEEYIAKVACTTTHS